MSRKTLLTTGCSAGGIGSALAHAFHSAGYQVFATARNPSKIDHSLAGLDHVTTWPLDVTSASEIEQTKKAISAISNGRLDVLVNNAGIGNAMPILDTDMDYAKQCFDTNFWSVIKLSQAFVPMLKEARGTIVNISSVAAVLNTPWLGIYSAAKAAVTSISEMLRLELAPFGITVLTVHTGKVDSRFWDNAHKPELPPNSLYSPIAARLADAAAGKSIGPSSPVEEFARDVVKAVDAGGSGLLWKGASAGSIWWASKLMPSFILYKFISSGRGLSELSARV